MDGRHIKTVPGLEASKCPRHFQIWKRQHFASGEAGKRKKSHTSKTGIVTLPNKESVFGLKNTNR